MSIIAGAVGAAAAGYAAWRFRSRPVPPSQHPDNEECRIAVHEAGHAVLALRCSVVAAVSITVRRESLAPGTGGAVVHRMAPHWSATDLEWCLIVIAMGGIAAENMIYGRFRAQPCGPDLLRCLAGARVLIRARCITPPWKNSGKSRPLKFRAMFAEALTDDEVTVLQRAYDTARNTLESHPQLHGRLTSAIFACEEMNAEVVARWAGDRSFIRTVGAFQARFL